MGKSVGIIGNFSGKLGNAVGFKNSASNDGRTQGVRIYQPVVKNPKSYAQALQRARMLPINNMYRLLKDIIDRGQEGVAYGNKSRLAWLKKAMKDFKDPWQQKGSTEVWPMPCQITKGSLQKFTNIRIDSGSVEITVGASVTAAPVTIAQLYAALLTAYPSLKEGDQVTIVGLSCDDGESTAAYVSFTMSSTDTSVVSGFTLNASKLSFAPNGTNPTVAAAVIISREGSNGAHLRSTQEIVLDPDFESENNVYGTDSVKAAAIRSYMTAGSNVDWPQEEISPNL